MTETNLNFDADIRATEDGIELVVPEDVLEETDLKVGDDVTVEFVRNHLTE